MTSPREHTGRLFGYRQWRVVGDELRSLNGHRWPADRPRAALCWRNFAPLIGHGHAPASRCRCGVYAYLEPPRFRSAPAGTSTVWGVVELTGVVKVHDDGFRAQYARPVALEHAPGIEGVLKRYGLLELERLEDWR